MLIDSSHKYEIIWTIQRMFYVTEHAINNRISDGAMSLERDFPISENDKNRLVEILQEVLIYQIASKMNKKNYRVEATWSLDTSHLTDEEYQKVISNRCNIIKRLSILMNEDDDDLETTCFLQEMCLPKNNLNYKVVSRSRVDYKLAFFIRNKNNVNKVLTNELRHIIGPVQLNGEAKWNCPIPQQETTKEDTISAGSTSVQA